MDTDPQRVQADVPGRVEGNPGFHDHEALNDDRAEVVALEVRYLQGAVGEGEVKARLTEALERLLPPIRQRRAEFEGRAGLIEQVLAAGTERARREAQATLRGVRQAAGMCRLPSR